MVCEKYYGWICAWLECKPIDCKDCPFYVGCEGCANRVEDENGQCLTIQD